MSSANAGRRCGKDAPMNGGTASPYLIALNAASDRDEAVAPAHAIALAAQSKAPDWIQLMPPGPDFRGVDGRAWRMSDAQAVINASKGQPLPIDFEHATHLKAPNGDAAPAAGWIEDFRVRPDGAIEARIDWTESGRKAVEAREYRFISPAFHHRKSDGEVVKIIHAGLVNQPNFTMTALNRKEDKPTMKLSAKLRSKLGLEENASEEDVLTAINSLQKDEPAPIQDSLRKALDLDENADDEAIVAAVNSAKSKAEAQTGFSLDKVVPRGDYDAAVNRAQKAENELAEVKAKDLDDEIDTALNRAIEDGKITPASREYHEAHCRQESGLDRFRKFADQQPEIAADGKNGAKAKGKDDAGQLDETDTAVCAALGLSEDDYLATKAGKDGGAAKTKKKENA